VVPAAAGARREGPVGAVDGSRAGGGADGGGEEGDDDGPAHAGMIDRNRAWLQAIPLVADVDDAPERRPFRPERTAPGGSRARRRAADGLTSGRGAAGRRLGGARRHEVHGMAPHVRALGQLLPGEPVLAPVEALLLVPALPALVDGDERALLADGRGADADARR